MATKGEAPDASSVVDVSSIPKVQVYLALAELTCKPEKAEDCAKGLDASQGRFYQSQPGVHCYAFGVSQTNPDIVLLTMIASNKELFYSLPQDAQDLIKLDAARGPFNKLIAEPMEESRRFSDSSFTVGSMTDLPAAVPNDSKVGWDETMGGANFKVDLAKVPRNSLYMVQVELQVQSGKAEEVAKGLEATQGRYYRQFAECLVYLHAVSSSKPDDTVLVATIWSSKEAFDSKPETASELDKLNKARAPYMALLSGTPETAMRVRDTSFMVGDKLFSSES